MEIELIDISDTVKCKKIKDLCKTCGTKPIVCKNLCDTCYQKYHRYGTADKNLIGELQKKYLEEKHQKLHYNDTNTCPKILSDGSVCGRKLIPCKIGKDIDELGNEIYVCKNCHDISLGKLKTKRRTGNLDPNSTSGKGDDFQKLSVQWMGFRDLNKDRDNYNSRIDHIDPTTGLYYQTQGVFYNPTYKNWITKWKRDNKNIKRNFVKIILYCASYDGKIIERIYEIPKEEVEKRTGVNIKRNPSRGGLGKNYDPWYEQYRIKDEETIKKVNEIWKKIRK